MYAAVHLTTASPHLFQLADAFSPYVEVVSADTVVFDVSGLRRMFGGAHQIASEIARCANAMGLQGNIGVAASVDTAILAARNCKGVTVIPPGEELRLLGDLKINALALSEEMQLLLDRWGIRTLADFCALPEGGVLERLGEEGRRLLRIARGDWQRPLQAMQHRVNYSDRIVLDHAIQLLEPLLFVISRLMHDLCARLKSNGRSTSEITLELELEGGGRHQRRMQIPFATREPMTWLKLLQLDLEANPPSKPVIAVELQITPVDPRLAQHNLYAPLTPQPEKLELTIGKIRAMVGTNNVGFAELLNTHRPDAYRMQLHPPSSAPVRSLPQQLPLAFRYFRPAKEAEVTVVKGAPQRIQAGGIVGAVEWAAGPWKLSGDWWTSQSWARTEWDVLLSNRTIYRLYLQQHRWYLEGVYD
ncbi:MAG: DNA polymerase Y family protein [Bryobacteraceae bacterium]|nr:DNA polymerase Y family protein [Bryobacteraceae bacterium]MDW8380040.1 DNA polymerase Y family protein [Bryobacterales bacterium]